MPSITQQIVEELLRVSNPLAEKDDNPFNYGYSDHRKVYQDPLDHDKHVVMVKSENAGDAAQPNVRDEAHNYIDNLMAAAISLVAEPIDMLAIEKASVKYKEKITKEIDEKRAKGDLYSPVESTKNQEFLEEVKKSEKILKEYTQLLKELSSHSLKELSGHSLKELDHQGHLLRSKNRGTMIHRFKVDDKTQDECFIMYIPAGRYTDRQLKLMNKESPERDHSTTSHNRKDLVLGNSNMARMIAGKITKDGVVTIQHDSFTGPGARMPYSDFKGADEYKKLAIKAVTLINQEEIIQSLAQRKFDRLEGLRINELYNKIPLKYQPQELPENSEEARKILIKLYLEHNPVTECYTQVVTAGQRLQAENQREQFEYVREMMDAFDGSTVKVKIKTSDGSEDAVEVKYKARMCSWGVNWFRHAGFFNPLSDNSVTIDQNARFVNQITQDVDEDLKDFSTSFQDDPKKIFNKLLTKISGPDVTTETTKIITAAAGLKDSKEKFRNKLFAYFEEYNKGSKAHQAKRYLLKKDVEDLEKEIEITEKEIFKLHQQIDSKRKKYFKENKENTKILLAKLKLSIEDTLRNPDINEEQKSNLRHCYNTLAYLIDSQELYYEETWHNSENNFKLQTLMACLAEELDYANTKGCKSNNDRGQKLAEQVVGNVLYTKNSDLGLYTGEFFSNRGEESVEVYKQGHMVIQALHHTANTGVSGGKFDTRESSWKNWNWDRILGGSTLLAAALVLLSIFFPPAGLFLAGLGLTYVTGGLISLVGFIAIGAGISAVISIFDKEKPIFNDNGLLGKVANFAKVEKMGPESVWTKDWKIKLGIGIVLAAASAALIIIFPPAGLFLAGLGLKILAGFIASAVACVTSFLFGALWSAHQNKCAYNAIKVEAKSQKACAERELSERDDSENKIQKELKPSSNEKTEANAASQTPQVPAAAAAEDPVFQPRPLLNKAENPADTLTGKIPEEGEDEGEGEGKGEEGDARRCP